MSNLNLLTFLFLSISSGVLNAQESINTSGKTISNVNGSLSYTIGQIVYTTNSSTAGVITQGVQQPLEIFTLGTNDFPNISLKMLIYPNPTTALVNLKIERLNSNALEYHFFDIMGNQISSQKINHAETEISLENLPSATYFLNVSDNNKIIKSFKIIKTN